MLDVRLEFTELKGTIWVCEQQRPEPACAQNPGFHRSPEGTNIVILTHLFLKSHKRDIGQQCRPRSDATERGVWSGTTPFALATGIF